MSNITTGRHGEKLAQDYLINQGYKILETNKHFSRFCEIDIIAQDRDTLVFCEVKTRKNNLCGSPLEAITKAKYSNIRKGAFLYLQENPICKKIRVDVISIVLEPKIEIKHLKNV